MRIASLAAAIAMSAVAAMACGQGAPASSLSKSPGTGVSRLASRYYQMPSGAYVMAYGTQHLDATVTVQGQSATVSFGGLSYSGPIAGNHFASTQVVTGHPALEGDLIADGILQGHYSNAGPRGVPLQPPQPFTLTMNGAGPTIHSGSGQTGISTSVAAQHELNSRPPPPKQGTAATKQGDANAINPQPLPPKPPPPDWGTRPGDRNSINPQPLPPEPNWGTKAQ